LRELPPAADENPFDRAATRARRSVVSARRRPMGPPFLNEAPQDYPSHLGPVPRAPDWEQVVPGATPWSPLAKPPRATDWGRFVAGPECFVSEDSTTCTTIGGRTVTFPRGGLRPGTRFAPGESDYHSYNISDGPVRGDLSSIMQGVINRPTRASPLFVRPATPQGTLNDATPPIAYPFGAALQTLRGQRPSTPGPVRSYLTTDQTGAQVVVNATEPGHPLFPGVVIRYVTESPSGPIIRNEGPAAVGCKDQTAPLVAHLITRFGLARGRRFLMNSDADEVGRGHLAGGRVEPMLLRTCARDDWRR
jgi:hypothetical protein